MANTTNWLSISSMSGSSGQTVLTLSAAKNLVGSAKTAEVTAYNPVYNISAKTYVSIEQYSPYITVAPGIIGVPGSGGTYTLSITANCSYTIAFPEMVSSYSTSAGTGNTTITFSVSSTTANTTVIGNIVITDESQAYSTLARIEQYGDGVHITVNPSAVTIPSSGGSVTLTVSADCIYDVYASSGSNFFTISPGSGYTGSTTFTITANGENTGNTDFTGSIVISAPGYQTTVSVVQKQPERRLIVGYQVGSTATGTPIMVLNSDTGYTAFSKIEYPDGTEISLSGTTGYTFPSTGMQYVYYTLTGDTIPDNLFKDCQRIRELQIPAQVTGVGAYAFSGHSLNEIILPPYLQTIGTYAFAAHTSRSTSTAVTIPDSVTSIGDAAFRFNGFLKEIYVSRPTPATIGSNVFSNGARDYEIIVPCPYMEAYLSAWSAYSEHITCQDDTTLYFTTDTSNVKGIGETRTITLLNGNLNPNRTGLNLPSDFPQQGAYVVSGNTIYLTYPRNPSSSSRTWTIGIVAQTNDGVSLSTSYQITQNGLVINTIPYTADTSTVAASGETRTITIDTSGLVASSITIGIEGATGVTYTYSNGVITITFPENTDFQKEITVTIDAVTTNDELANATVVFTQESGWFVIVETTYYVTSTTEPTRILYDFESGTPPFKSARLENNTVVPIATGFTFPATGLQKVYYTLIKDYLPENCFGYSSSFSAPRSIVASNLYSIIIPYGVKTIKRQCFQSCDYLKYVSIANSVTTIEEEAFKEAGYIYPLSIIMPDSVTSYGRACFFASSIEEIHISSGVTVIPELCFRQSALKTLYIPDTVTEIGPNNTTYGGAIETDFKWLRVSSNITRIPDRSIDALHSIQTIVMGRGNTVYYKNPNLTQDRFASTFNTGGTLYYPCTGNYDDWYDGNGAASHYTYDYLVNFNWTMDCFNNESSLTTYSTARVTGDNGTLHFSGGTRTFYVSEFIGPNPVITWSCSGATGVTLTPSSDGTSCQVTVPSNDDDEIKTITVSVSASSYNGELVCTGQITLEQMMHLTTGTVATYYVTSTTDPTVIVGSVGSNRNIYAKFPDGTQRLLDDWENEYTFSTTGVQTIEYQLMDDANPSLNPHTIKENMFAGCPNLLSVSISSAITDILNGNFSNCDMLSAVSIPNSVTAISYDTNWQHSGQHCFDNCPSLQSITIPDSVVYLCCHRDSSDNISNLNCYFCRNNTSLTSVTIGSGLSSAISFVSPFNGCTNLQNIYMYPQQAPGLTSNRISNLSNTGTLYYPAGSNYDWWVTKLSNNGNRNWTGSPTL